MRLALRGAITILLGLVVWAGMFHAARAAAPYQGIYVVIDPYNQGAITDLKTAASTPCSSAGAATISPFCGAANGILLRVPWCDFELYHVRNAQGVPYSSCHYAVGFTGGVVGALGVQQPMGDMTSPCNGTYDTCVGSVSSLLGSTLHIISRIDNQRAASGLPPLNISLGMYAGVGTPEAELDATGFVDVPDNTAVNSPGTETCNRLPLAWKSGFTTAYLQAFDMLLATVAENLGSDANIVMLKVGSIASNDLEIQMPGQLSLAATATDPGPFAPDGAVACSSDKVSAATWLVAYAKSPNPGQNFSEANETAFGSVIGHLWGSLANQGISGALISVATTNDDDFANVDCGISGATPCSVQPAAMGDWSLYYLQKYLNDLFDGGVAETAAQAAYDAVRTDTYALPPTSVAVDSTALSPTPPVSIQQVPCNINNTDPANEPSQYLNNVNVSVLGAGTVVGWQTATNQGSLCATGNTYQQALDNGIADGGLFLEVEDDAAFADLSTCSPYLANALTQILAASPPQTCVY